MEQFEGKNILSFVKELPNDDLCMVYLSNINGKMALHVQNAKAKRVV